MYKIDFSNPASVYFVGIGGVSMSGLAELLADKGFRVSGSDRAASPITQVLEQKGIKVFYGQRRENITDDIDCVVFTSAIGKDNPEYVAAHEKNIPCLTRGELLGQVMLGYPVSVAVSGTHGKTTTTSMISEILLHADTDPTVFVGGMLKSIGGNVRIGRSDYLVTEACEYTNSFLSFFPTVGLILNVEEDHLDFFKDLADIRCSFRKFAELLPADGCLIINGSIDRYSELTEGLPCKVVTYGLSDTTSENAPCSYYASDVSYDEQGHPTFLFHSAGREPRRIALGVPGSHNIENALAALALADVLELDLDGAAGTLSAFTGAGRRFEYKGTIAGVNIVDDYAHHPTEITATLTAASNLPHKTLWCVFQPHTYSRTKAFLKDFAKALSLADAVVLTDIYAAREKNTCGISSADLRDEILALGKRCEFFPTFDETENFLLENCINGDLLITMGAGDVHKIGEKLLGQ